MTIIGRRKLVGGTILLLGIVLLVTPSGTEETPKEVRQLAKAYLRGWIARAERNPELYSFTYGVDDIEKLQSAVLGNPYKVYFTSYKELANVKKGIDILSSWKFRHFAFPIVVGEQVVAVYEVSDKEIHEGGIGGAHSVRDVDSFAYEVVSKSPESAEIFILDIDYMYRYVGQRKDDQLYIAPGNDRSAKVLLLEPHENGKYAFVPIANTLGQFKKYAEQQRLSEERAAEWRKSRRLPSDTKPEVENEDDK